MIDYEGQEQDRPQLAAIPDDIKWLGGNLQDVVHWTHKVYDALRRQESPNPTVLNLDPNAGNPGTNKGTIVSTTTRQRAYALVFSGGTAGEVFSVRVGSSNSWDFIVPASPAPFTMPCPLIFDAGVDVQIVDITTPGATNWRCKVLAYAELEDGNA